MQWREAASAFRRQQRNGRGRLDKPASTPFRKLQLRSGDSHPAGRQAARTEVRNFDTSARSRPESVESVCAAESTCEEAEPVSAAPRCTSAMLEDTCWVPVAAC